MPEAVPNTAPDPLGNVRPVRDLAPSAVGERWLALDDTRHSSHVLHVLRGDEATLARVGAILEKLSHATDPHVLRVEESVRRGAAIVVRTDYAGHSDGVITLDALLAVKGGVLSAPEAARGVRHLLDALLHTRALGIINGELDVSQCLVDRHGRVVLELPGVRVAMSDARDEAELRREEIRSLGVLAHRLFTGVLPGETRRSGTRGGTRLDAAWERWLTRAIAPMDGYADVAAAARDYPSVPVRAD